jgi:predicted house-cleaning noncanonical NTP pyrophosphatase (MazG superfamily)
MVQMDADGKLIRDRIPEIIEDAGGQPSSRVLDEVERLSALLAKLQEESDELRAAAPRRE